MVLRSRKQGVIAYALWFVLGYLLLVQTGLISNVLIAAAIVLSSMFKDMWDHRRGIPAGPWYLDHYPLVMYVLAYTVFTHGYGVWNPPLLAASSVTAVVDVIQDWFTYIQEHNPT